MTRREYRSQYRKEYQIRRYQERKAAAIAQLGGVCVECGSAEGLQFHHRDRGAKAFVITTRLATRAKAALQAELAKCELLCGSCHKAHHPRAGICGTDAEYSSGCRCAECKAAHSLDCRNRQSRRRLKEWFNRKLEREARKRTRSSVGENTALLKRGPQVQVLPGAPHAGESG